MTAPIVPIFFGGLIAWSIYRRVRRNVGQQKLRSGRIIRSIVILSVVTLLIFSASLHLPKLTLGLAGGLLPGALLGLIGLKLTKFETNDEGHFYTPDMRIGVGLSLLFVGRLIYRFWALHGTTTMPKGPQPFQSPLTLVIFGLIAGYYLVYYIGLFVHTRDRK